MRSEGTDTLAHISEPLRLMAVKISALHTDEHNVRVHPQRNIDVIRASLEKFGQQGPVVYVLRGRRKVVIKGNGLLAAAKQLGWKHLAAVKSDLAGHDATAFAIVDNQSTDLSAFDEGLLTAQLQELEEAEYDFEVTGFSDDELTKMLEDLESAGEPIGTDRPTAAERKRGERVTWITVGHLKFEVPRQRFDQWISTIEAKVGSDPDRVVKELKRRLKIGN